MSDRKDRTFLADMLESARMIQEYVRGVTEGEFYANSMLQDAVSRRFAIIGEAATRVSEATRAQIPQVPWKLVIGMRNRLIHEYDNVRTDVVWASGQDDVTPLIGALAPWVESEERLGENF